MSTPANSVAAVTFTPKTAPNVVFLVIFISLFSLHIFLTLRFLRRYGYAIGMLCGLLLEFLGYAAKVQLSHNRTNKSAYIMYIIGLTLGPTFLSSSLYLSIGALQRRFFAGCFGMIGPRLFASLFILGDFICLCFIGVGGSLAAIYAPQPIGVDLMIAGLASQVLFTAIFCVVLAVFCKKLGDQLIKGSWRLYTTGAAVAAACLFIRSCWRVAELSGGFNGPLTSKEGVFIALDSVPMVIMSAILTSLHPGIWFVESTEQVSYTAQGRAQRMGAYKNVVTNRHVMLSGQGWSR